MRPYRARFRGQGVFFAFQSWAGCITNIFGFDLRQAHVRNVNSMRPDETGTSERTIMTAPLRLWNVRQMRLPSRRKRHRIGHDRWRAARRRHVKLLSQFAVEGSLSGAYSHPIA